MHQNVSGVYAPKDHPRKHWDRKRVAHNHADTVSSSNIHGRARPMWAQNEEQRGGIRRAHSGHSDCSRAMGDIASFGHYIFQTAIERAVSVIAACAISLAPPDLNEQMRPIVAADRSRIGIRGIGAA
jgi:hypothetical protein